MHASIHYHACGVRYDNQKGFLENYETAYE